MNYVDVFLIAIFLLAAIQGYKRGLVLELFSLLAIFFGIFAAIRFSRPLAAMIVGEDSEWIGFLKIVTFALLFIGISVIINLVARILRKTLQLAFLGWLDSIFGVFIGVVKWGFLVSMIVWMLMAGGFALPERDLSQSVIFPYIAHLGPKAVRFLDEAFPFMENLFDWGEEFKSQKRFV